MELTYLIGKIARLVNANVDVAAHFGTKKGAHIVNHLVLCLFIDFWTFLFWVLTLM